MSLLASFLGTRSTRAAVVLAVALHAVVLFGLVQYSRAGHTVRTAQPNTDIHRPITVFFVSAAARAVAIAAPTPVPTPLPRPQPVAPTPAHTRPAVQAPPQAALKTPTTKEAIAEAAPAAAPHPVPVTHAGAVDTPLREARSLNASHRPDDMRPDGPPLQAGKPDYAYNPQPDYPMLLREQGVGGVVWLRVWVDSDGHPGEIKLAKGSGYRLLDESALRAVRQWRFVPAKKGDQSLASWVEFAIRFTLNG